MLVNLAFPGVVQCPCEINPLYVGGLLLSGLVWTMSLARHAAGCVGHIGHKYFTVD